jgi:hypothetical protein
MKKIKSIVFVLCVMGCSLITTKAVAQDDGTPGFPGGPEGPGAPVAPIDNWILPMLLMGVGLMFMIYKKQLKQERK